MRNDIIFKRSVQFRDENKNSWTVDFEVYKEELYDPPIILVNLNDGPMDVVIHKVWLHDGCIELSAFDNEWGNQVDIELEDIVPGHLAYLIEYMPVTDKVKSVAINDD